MTRQTKPKTNPRILCIGLTPCLQRTLFFDGFRTGEVNRARSVEETASGKATNVARILRQIGGRSFLIGFAGGERGRFLQEKLDREGQEQEWTSTARNTRICQTLIDQKTGAITELVEEAWAPSEPEIEAFRELLKRRLAGVLWTVISGSPPPEMGAGFYGECVEKAAKQNAKVILDAQKEPLYMALPRRPFLVKCNQEELEKTLDKECSRDKDMVSGMEEVMKQGAENVLITQGKKGALLKTADSVYRLYPPSVQALNPIGSGDAMTAGIAWSLAKGDSWEQALALGGACGAANALTATSGTLHTAQVFSLLETTKVERIM